jgi:Family of unknown function (DUF6600)/FecR protein
MFKQTISRLSSVSPRVAVAGALIIVVIISGVALLLTRGGSEANANPAMQPHAARLDRIEGSVGIARAEDNDKELDWAEASVNTPVTVGDRIYARDYANASIALTGHNYVRLNPATSIDVLALEDRQTQFALRSGSALFDIGALDSGELYEVATPCGAVDFKEPGLYQVGIEGENAIISVLNGLAQIVGQEGSGYISKGQVFTLEGATTQALASTLAHDTAGEIVDDYYRYRYPKAYDGRYRRYDAYLSEPSYYDSYRTSVSYQYLPVDIAGLYDLDDYGDWVDVNNYGHCWAPRVNAGWAPFRSGYWDLDDLWGPSWVSSEPWGWAPYHYGRWAFVNQRWFWVPVEVRTRATYCPAPVAFIPLADQIAWVPLGPGEVYVSRYYDNYQPQYLAPTAVVQVVQVPNAFFNFNAPGALTIVPVRSFTRGIDPRQISPVDTVVVGRSRAVLDPFSVAGIRELAVRHDDGRRRIKIDHREQQVLNRAVVAGATPQELPARGDFAKRLRVEAAPAGIRERKLNIKDTAQVTSSRRPDGLPQPAAVQSQRMSELADRAEHGDKSARREMRQLMREEQKVAQPPGVQKQVDKEQSSQQMKQQMKQQRRAERQNQNAQSSKQQMKQQRKAERQQPPAASGNQKQQMRQQRNERKRKPPEVSIQQVQQHQQIKQQRRAERAQSPPAAKQQRQQMRQQRKTPRSKPPETYAQHQWRQQSTQVSQGKVATQQSVIRGDMNKRAAPLAQFKSQRRPEQQRVQKQQQQAAERQTAHATTYQGPPAKHSGGSQSSRKAPRKPPQ